MAKVKKTNKKGTIKKTPIQAMNEARALNTALKKEMFLKEYANSAGIVALASKNVNINRGTYYEWLRSDQIFADRIKELEPEQVGWVEDKLYQQIAKGNIVAIIFYLKKKSSIFKEEPYRGNQTGGITQATQTNIIFIGQELIKILTETGADSGTIRKVGRYLKIIGQHGKLPTSRELLGTDSR